MSSVLSSCLVAMQLIIVYFEIINSCACTCTHIHSNIVRTILL